MEGYVTPAMNRLLTPFKRMFSGGDSSSQHPPRLRRTVSRESLRTFDSILEEADKSTTDVEAASCDGHLQEPGTSQQSEDRGDDTDPKQRIGEVNLDTSDQNDTRKKGKGGKRGKEGNEENSRACTPSCTIKKKAPMFRCCLCMIYYHPGCINDTVAEAKKGVWCCIYCRQLPGNVTMLMRTLATVQTEVQRLSQTSTSYAKLQGTIDSLKKKNESLSRQLEHKTAECETYQKRLETISKQKTSTVTTTAATPQPASTTSSDDIQQRQTSPPPSSPDHRQRRSGKIILGSSILRDVDSKKLGADVYCKSGGHVKDIREKVQHLDKEYDRIILHVGGNDACTSRDAQDVVNEYRLLLEDALERADHVTVSSILPRPKDSRADDKIEDINAGLVALCEELGCSLVDNNETFVLRDDTVNTGYFDRGQVHLNTVGTNRLMQNLGLSAAGDDITRDRRRGRGSHGNSWGHRHHGPPPHRHSVQHDQRREQFTAGQRDQRQGGYRQRQPRATGDYDRRQRQQRGRPQRQCYHCGDDHDVRDCRFRSRVRCYTCGRLGHKAALCRV